MHFSTKEKSYGGLQGSGITGVETAAQGSVTNASRQSQSYLSNKIQQRKQTVQVRRVSKLDSGKNEQLFESFPQLNIHRVDSAEHRERMKSNEQGTAGYQPMTNSLIAKPYSRADNKLTSTSVDKTGHTYLNPKQNNFPSNQSDTNKASYRYATYNKKEGTTNNLIPNYTYGAGSDDGSDNNDVPSYKRIAGAMTMERMDMEISPKMVSSVISRESSGKDGNEDRAYQRVYLSTNSKNKDDEKDKEEEAYELFASRHPNESIRKSTIEISKAISSNAITELQKTNEIQQKKIKKMQKQLEQFKNSLKKWDEIKHRYQMDLQSKSRQIFDLQRVNKRLTEQVQGIRAYRTMETVEQVIIVRLKEEIMQLNKKIIEMQAEHYKNQKSLLQKQNRKDGGKVEIENQKEVIRKLEETAIANRKQVELLGIQLQKEKQKSWNLQRQKEQYQAGKVFDKQNYERELSNNKKQILSLRQEVQKSVEAIRLREVQLQGSRNRNDQEAKKINQKLNKQIQEYKRALDSQNTQFQKLNSQLKQKDQTVQQRLAEQKRNFDKEIADRLTQKQQEYKVALNNQMRLYESKIVEQGKSLNLKQSEQKQMLDRLRSEKEQSQSQLKKKIVEVEDSLRATNQRLAQKDEQIKTIESKDKGLEQTSSQFRAEIQNLRSSLAMNQRYLAQLKVENENIKNAIRQRDMVIDTLKADNMKIIGDMDREIHEKAKWKQEETFIIENQIKVKLQEQFKRKQKDLENKTATVNALKTKLEQDQQQQAFKLQAQMKEKQQKVFAEALQKEQQSIRQLQSTKSKLNDEVKRLQLSFQNLNREVAAATSKKTQMDSQFALKQREAKEIETQIAQFKVQLQTKLTQLSQAQSQKKSALAEVQRLKETEQKQKSSSKQLEIKFKEAEAKYNSCLSEFNNFKVQFTKQEQKCRQSQAQANRANQTLHTWKSRSEVFENSVNKLKGDIANLEKQRQQLMIKAREAQQNKGKGQIAKKYDQLLPEFQLLQQKLKIKEEELINREAAYLKVRQHSESGQAKTNNLVKQVRNLSHKLEEAESKLRTILSKTQAEQYKYKELFDKMVADTQVYMNFIKKLQEDNELIAQKYWKVRKLVKKEKIHDDNETLEKHDYATYREFLEHEILGHFRKMIIPAFEAKIMQKIGACEASIAQKEKRLGAVKALADYVKRRRQAEKARLKN